MPHKTGNLSLSCFILGIGVFCWIRYSVRLIIRNNNVRTSVGSYSIVNEAT